ncbi:hypothetical protein SESBI_42923 [Sesbania bispinosa]|nr:hypothetical protein SESBI_42923 [Sesbania bispinosa]
MATVLPAISSDHTPILFEVEPEDRSGVSFKYEVMWNEHTNCKRIVQEGWHHPNLEDDIWTSLIKKTTN